MPTLIVDHKAGYTLSRKFIKIFNEELDYPEFVKEYYDTRGTDCYKYNFFGKIIYKIINNKFIKKFLFNKFLELKLFYIFNNNINKNEKYIVIIRDPREIIVSGYLYHKNNDKCKEHWCTSSNVNYFDFWLKGNINQTQFKKNFKFYNNAKKFSDKITYQKKLKYLSVNQGIIHEMNNVAYITLKGFLNFSYFKNKNVLVVKLEDLIYNSDDSLNKICNFLNIDDFKRKNICKRMRRHSLLKNAQNLPIHVTNMNLSRGRYKKYWNKKINKEFNKLFPRILKKLNY